MITQTTTPEPRKAYFVSQLEQLINNGYTVCIAVENEPGYYRTNWYWNTDFATAEQLAAEKNAALGLTEKDAARIIFSSMRPAK
jgi:hypothetical protein